MDEYRPTTAKRYDRICAALVEARQIFRAAEMKRAAKWCTEQLVDVRTRRKLADEIEKRFGK